MYLYVCEVNNLSLGVQVLSRSVGSIMAAYGGLEKEETDKFILLMRAA